MNLQEFAALKVGDKIENHAFGIHAGEVTAVTDRGVRVKWGGPGTTAIDFFYSVQGTAWFHWSKVQEIATCDKCGTAFTVNGPTQCPRCEQA